MKIRAAVLAALVLTPLFAGCERQALKVEEELLAAIDRTERLSGRFIYVEETPGREVEVRGVVEDDLRYKTQMLIDGAATYEEVVSDDVIASRFLDPTKFELMANPNPPPPDDERDLEPGEQPKLAGRKVVQALEARRWVVDFAGAPNLLAANTAKKIRKLGEDPVIDSLTVFDYLEKATREAIVSKFNPDALDYREKEDPFSKVKPDRSKGQIRYDLIRPNLPRADEAASNVQSTPGTRHFRFMSIFVTKGKVTRVLEKIQVTGKLVEKLEKYLRAYLKDKLPALLEGFNKQMKELDAISEEAKASVLMQILNRSLQTAGNTDPVRLRTMSLELRNLGEDISVKLPDPAETLLGDLSVLQYRGESAGRVPPGAVPGAAGGGGAEGGGGDGGEAPPEEEPPAEGEPPAEPAGEAPPEG